jgi:hypothetical protein
VESFGKYLLKKAIVSIDELEEATQALVLVGGRLGTNLVELGHLGMDELDRHLSDHLGVPAPPKGWLEKPSAAAVKAVPAELRKRHQILPLALEERTLHMALVNPWAADAVDEVAFATGLTIKTYVVSEVHLEYLRERHLGIAREGRFAHIEPHRASKPRKRKGEGGRRLLREGSAAAAEREEAQRNREEAGIRPLGEQEELIDDGTFTSLHENWKITHPSDAKGSDEAEVPLVTEVGEGEDEAPPQSTPVGPLTPVEVARLEAEIEAAPDREAIALNALRLSLHHASAVALFVVHRGVICGYRAAGAVIAEHIDGLLIPVDSPSVLSQTVTQGSVFRGAPPDAGIDQQIFRALGRSDAADAAILPVRIRDHVVNLLYVDNGPEVLAESSVAALTSLCECISRAYGRLILAHKQRHC